MIVEEFLDVLGYVGFVNWGYDPCWVAVYM